MLWSGLVSRVGASHRVNIILHLKLICVFCCQGVLGIRGSPGTDGATGVVGATGPSGDKGATGPQGATVIIT